MRHVDGFVPRVIKVILFYFSGRCLSGTDSLSTWLDTACPFSDPFCSSGDEEAVIVPEKISGSACALNQPSTVTLDGWREEEETS